jgi:hypothetical protein
LQCNAALLLKGIGVLSDVFIWMSDIGCLKHFGFVLLLVAIFIS